MNVHVLIDSVVRQTTVLIAQLATAGGGRPSLAHTANQVFVNLVRELRHQGVGNKVIADMFGMALRTYYDRVRRLDESATYAGRSLWQAVFEYVQQEGPLLLADVLRRFQRDDDRTVRSVLNDLSESGLVFRTGRGARTTFRAASPEDVALVEGEERLESLANLVWVTVNRDGPLTTSDLEESIPANAADLQRALELLLADGRVVRTATPNGDRYSCDGCVIASSDPHGWEAAVFDHFQALVSAVSTKLRVGPQMEGEHDLVGGSTYTYWVWEGHPMRDEVVGLLTRTRREAAALRQRLDEYNTVHGVPRDNMMRVITYVGQTVQGADRRSGDDATTTTSRGDA